MERRMPPVNKNDCLPDQGLQELSSPDITKLKTTNNPFLPLLWTLSMLQLARPTITCGSLLDCLHVIFSARVHSLYVCMHIYCMYIHVHLPVYEQHVYMYVHTSECLCLCIHVCFTRTLVLLLVLCSWIGRFNLFSFADLCICRNVWKLSIKGIVPLFLKDEYTPNSYQVNFFPISSQNI